MRLPAFLKAVVGCTDTESSRFSLGGVKCEHTAGVSCVTATNGIAHANLCDGRYPRWRDVFGDTGEHHHVILDPALVIDVLKVFKDAGLSAVNVYAHGDNRPAYFAATTPAGEVVRAIVMHKEGDKAPMPDEYRPSEPTESGAPEPECSEPECSEAGESDYADESVSV